MQNPSLEIQRKYEAKLIREQLLYFILCLVILLHSILQTAPPPLPLQKRQPTTQKAFILVDGAGDPGEAVVSRNILFTNSESRIVGRDFGSLVYYGVAKISLS